MTRYNYPGKEIPFAINYSVTDKGLIHDFWNQRYLEPKMLNGVQTVNITDNEGNRQYHKVHILIADIYLPNPYDLKRVIFKDGNKNNVKLSNLKRV